MNRKCAVPVFLSVLLLAGCNGSGDGRLTIALTDSAMDNASAVVIEFTGVTVQQSTGTPITYTFKTPRQIDFVPLQNGVRTPLISGFTLPPGHYDNAELLINSADSYITLKDGTQHALVLGPTGTQATRIRYLTSGFDVNADATSWYTIDFDMRKSILDPAPPSTAYILEPSYRMVKDDTVGNIIGTVSSGLIGASCTPVVYTYAGTVSTPTDLDSTAAASTQPVTESPVKLNASSGAYEFTAAYLPAGTYTLALTCDAAADDPAKPDSIAFVSTGTAPTLAGGTILVNMR